MSDFGNAIRAWRSANKLSIDSCPFRRVIRQWPIN